MGEWTSSQRVTRLNSECSLPKRVTRTRARGSKLETHLAVGLRAPLARPTSRSPCSVRKDTTSAPSWKGVGRRTMADWVLIIPSIKPAAGGTSLIWRGIRFPAT